MLMTPLLDYVPDPGELIEFRIPDAAVERATHAPVHPAPPSYVQENHILRRLANEAAGREQSPWLGIVFDLPGRIDTTAMAGAVEKWVLRHGTLLTWFSRADSVPHGEPVPDSGAPLDSGSVPGSGNGTRLVRHAVPAELVSIESVRHGVRDSAQILAHLTERFAADTDPMRWPPFTAGAVLRADGAASTVYFAVDHAHSDGFSVLLVFSELRALYEAEITGVPAALPETGSYVDACTLDRERAARIEASSPQVRQWLDFFLAGPPPGFPLDLGTQPGQSYPSVSVELDLLDTAQAHAFAQVCKALGSGFSAGLLTALGIVGHELGGHDTYRGLTVVHTRDERRWQFTQGWFINLVPVQFPVAADGRGLGFAEALAGAQRSFDAARTLATVSPLRVAELIPGASLQSDAATVLPMTSYLDLRHAPGSRDWVEANCNALVGPGRSSEVPMWVNRLWDRTYLKTRYPDTPAARTHVPQFLEHLREVLREIARTGTYAYGARRDVGQDGGHDGGPAVRETHPVAQGVYPVAPGGGVASSDGGVRLPVGRG
ncbi:condensation domain-containing protein [Streptomyces zagrosensis]|uniref:Condensation domain-containing protein n=1 Tax=Streptomyces zagrosensis TaxID=1042984 RepID=A0A7W9Q7G9_9ACTN|nr:condensation domain-containing protein [Streptomyces zagrosensis]MBB5933952.1 hypothetical protein [Streptomyces zagrosensis]